MVVRGAKTALLDAALDFHWVCVHMHVCLEKSSNLPSLNEEPVLLGPEESGGKARETIFSFLSGRLGRNMPKRGSFSLKQTC